MNKQEKQLTHHDFFFCYSERLANFLSNEGVAYVTKGRNIKNEMIYTMFQKGEQLQRAIDKYKNRNKNRNKNNN